jgi:hypothetical protein
MMIAKSMNDPGKAQKFLNKDREATQKAGRDLAKEEARLSGMEKGGKVRATGKRKLHKGEIVARKEPRGNSRGCKR